ncbi:MAG: cytidylate kinase family protein, partial [Chloroflexi bacterium]|nr:cytidylate kinase family protein [Chloroflexota bacterium]
MAVITFGGQIGAGANKIGVALASKLGYEYHNRSV